MAAIAADRTAGTSDFRDFWRTAEHFRQTGEISADLGVHNYLPAFTILMTPFSLMPLPAAAGLFVALSCVLLAATVLLAERMLRPGGDGPRPAMLAAVGLMAPYMVSCAVLGQLGLVLAFLVVLAWRMHERGRDAAAGALLGLAAVVKLLPGLLLLPLLLRGRWRAVAAGAGTVALAGLALPAAVVGVGETWNQHAAFVDRAAVEHSSVHTILAEKPIKAMYSNNALPIVLRRVLSDVNAGKGEEADAWRINIAELPLGVILSIYLVLAVAVLALSIAATVRPGRGDERDDASRRELERARFGVWCCAVLLLAPLVWTHYLVLLYWPLALACDGALGGRHARALLGHGTRASLWHGTHVLVARMALAVWLLSAVLLAWPAARAAGAQLVAVVALWVCMLVACRGASIRVWLAGRDPVEQ